MKIWDVIIVGGGAAGFFTAINYKELNPDKEVLIIEKDKDVLKKVKISGGGRCNVTHACFEPTELAKHYPRGRKELLGPFHQFCTGDMMGWLDDRGVPTKIEEDNRVFPISDDSQSIIDCFLREINRLKIKVNTRTRLDKIAKKTHWELQCGDENYQSINLVFASGSNPKVWQMIQRDLGHQIVEPVPSLFTFNSKDSRIIDLMGISVPNAQVKVLGSNLASEGPLLITHWGLSGPAVLKLSAWGARTLNEAKYDFNIEVNWLAFETAEACKAALQTFKLNNGKKSVIKHSPYALPKRLWESFANHALTKKDKNWGDITKQELNQLVSNLVQCRIEVKGKSTFKEEFVTAGGVELAEVDFKSFQSKLHNKLYFAGEVLNIDAITGGFNFQAAWTGSWIIAQQIDS